MLYFEQYAKVEDVLNLKEDEEDVRAHVLTCPIDISFRDLIAFMNDYKVGAVYLENEEGQIKGVVSERDIIHHLAMYDLKAFDEPVSGFMCTEIISCKSSDPLKWVASVMADKKIRHIAVRDEAGTLIGVVSARDIERFAGNG